MPPRRLSISALLAGLCIGVTGPLPRVLPQPAPGPLVSPPQPPPSDQDRWEPLLPRSVLLGNLVQTTNPEFDLDRTASHEPCSLLPSERVTRDLHFDPSTPVNASGKLERAFQLPMSDSLFVFSQVGSETESEEQTRNLAGKTGVGCKMALLSFGEIMFRTGPTLNWEGGHRPDRPQDRKPIFLEMQGHVPLLGIAGVEYVGSAFPALDPTERDRLEQDLRLVVPLKPDWQLRIGAKHSWDNITETQPSPTSLQFYVGSGLKW